MVIMLSECRGNNMHIIGIEDKIKAAKNQRMLRLTIKISGKEAVLYKYISGERITEEKVDLLKESSSAGN